MLLLLLLASRARQSLTQEVQGGVPLLHQLGRCGVHLGAGEVVDGESVNHLPGLVLWATERKQDFDENMNVTFYCVFRNALK